MAKPNISASILNKLPYVEKPLSLTKRCVNFRNKDLTVLVNRILSPNLKSLKIAQTIVDVFVFEKNF